MDPLSLHRELLLPPPSEEPPEVPPLVWASSSPFWLEIHRWAGGRVQYLIGGDPPAVARTLAIQLENARPRLAAGSLVPCPASALRTDGVFARAVPQARHHYWPLQLRLEADLGGFLLRSFASEAFRDHDVVVQLLAQRIPWWESTFFTPLYEDFAQGQNRKVQAIVEAKHAEAAYHVELRAHVSGPEPLDALSGLQAWLGQWTTPGGYPWRLWEAVPTGQTARFREAFAAHDLQQFASRKGRRDVCATELTHLLSIPWAAHHPECSYSGAPAGQPDSTLVVRSPADPRLVVGNRGAHPVALPAEWHHLAVLGRTQSGKSTLAQNLVLQILAKQPGAAVVVIEPTGRLVEGIVARLPRDVGADTVEIDPAHATFDRDGTTMASVPLSLLRRPDDPDDSDIERDRWSEALASDLLTAIRNAWGEESIGGRAELILRALVHGLSTTPGSNLVDAYHLLSSKAALQRFVQTAPPGPLRTFLEGHLPRFGYEFTMSSLDKVGKVATNPLLRVALCQRSGAVPFDRLLGHRLLLLNLSKAAVGADGANFLGAVYLTQLWAALQRRGRVDRPVYLVLDEVHNYSIPALSDMLSEGAKFGLHIVAVTQFLHRVPPRMRAALVGNVDAWAVFSLGAEDTDDAWKILNGERHGWTPQDLVDGLRPHEVALAVSGNLVKLATSPSLPPAPWAAGLKDAVTASSRRYAQPEDSEASPWLIGPEEVEGSLQGLVRGPRTRDELGKATLLPPDHLNAALTRAAAEGDVVRGESDGRFYLTARGNLHFKALQNRRNEGEEHVETLTELALFLGARGIDLNVPKQVAGVLLPDGQFQWGDAIYNVEVECSTVAKAAGQVARNVKKGRAAGCRVLVVVPRRDRIGPVLNLLGEEFPGLRLWADGVGLLWRYDRASFEPHRVPGTRVWPFLDPEGDHELVEPVELLPPPLTETDPLSGYLRAALRDLWAAGRSEVTSRELLAALSPTERAGRTEEQVGVVLSAMGVEQRRVRTEKGRLRVYDLSTFVDPSGTPKGPAAGPAADSLPGDGRDEGDAGPAKV
jgi:hypothetical protein